MIRNVFLHSLTETLIAAMLKSIPIALAHALYAGPTYSRAYTHATGIEP